MRVEVSEPQGYLRLLGFTVEARKLEDNSPHTLKVKYKGSQH